MKLSTKTVVAVWCLAVLLCTVARCQEIKGPDKGPIKVGRPMLFKVDGAEASDTIKWQLLKPLDADVTVIETPDGSHYILDTGCNYRGDVQVLCTLVNFQNQKFDQVVLQAVVEGEIPEPYEPTPPTPPRPPDGDYDGPNDLGIGKVSFDNAPGYDREVSQLLVEVAESLYGRPKLRVIYTSNEAKNKTDYNAIVYLKGQLEDNHPEWDKWYNAVFEKIQDNNTDVLRIKDWYASLMEAAEGIKAKKPE